jgi:MFS family permease
MAMGQALNIGANLLFAYGRQSFLMPASALMGFCFGVQVSIMIPTASELFGLKHFGVIYNFINMSIPLSSLLFSVLLAGQLYVLQAGPDNQVCYGVKCFQLTFITLAIVCVLGLLVSLVLSYRIRPVYKTLYPSGTQNSTIPQSDAPSSAVRQTDVASSSLEEPQASQSQVSV